MGGGGCGEEAGRVILLFCFGLFVRVPGHE